MGRDRRQRSKQRRPRREPDGERGELLRTDVPGAGRSSIGDHASAEVDEFDAALVRGADGVPVAPEDSEPETELETEPETEPESGGRGDGGGAGGGNGVGGGGQADESAFGRPAPREAAGAGGPRASIAAKAVAFLRASWAELQRVQWPDRREVTQATAVVLGFVAVAGVYLGVADWVAQKIINFIL